MADKIKKFFAKKKADVKFKQAGPGKKLTDMGNSSSTTTSTSYLQHTSAPGPAQKQAAEAALNRLRNQTRPNENINTSLRAIQAQVKRELEAEKKRNEGAASSDNGPSNYTGTSLAVEGIFWRCPLVSNEILTKGEWKDKMKNFLYEQLTEEKGLTSCLIINSCNYNRIKVQECINVLIRYLDNIINNPTEEKYHKIRIENPTFREKVDPLCGVSEFLEAVGFRRQKLDHNGKIEDFWVFNEQNIESFEKLKELAEVLRCGDRVELELDRNIKVLSPVEANRKVDLPPDFFNLTVEELRREQQNLTDQMEKQLQLRTKAMREREEQREAKKYKYALIRVRFPDGLYLQGTFSVYENFSEVIKFTDQSLFTDGLPFVLSSPTGKKFQEEDYQSSLLDLKLVPSHVLIFQWDASISEEIARAGHESFLKPELMMTVAELKR